MLDSHRAPPESTLCTETLHSEGCGFSPGHPPALLASDTGIAFGVLWQELGGKKFLQPAGSKISEYFVGPAQDKKVKTSNFSLKESENTFWEREELFLTRPECSLLLSYFMGVLYNNWAKMSQGKSNFHLKNVSVWRSTKSKIQAGLKKNNIFLNLFYGCVWRSWHLFCWKVPALPQVQNCSFSVQQFFRVAFQNQLEQSERQVIFMQVFWPRTVIFACMHKHKK